MNREQLNAVTMAVSFLSLALSLALVLKGDTVSFYLRYATYLTWIVFLVVIGVFFMVEISDLYEQTSR